MLPFSRPTTAQEITEPGAPCQPRLPDDKGDTFDKLNPLATRRAPTATRTPRVTATATVTATPCPQTPTRIPALHNPIVLPSASVPVAIPVSSNAVNGPPILVSSLTEKVVYQSGGAARLGYYVANGNGSDAPGVSRGYGVLKYYSPNRNYVAQFDPASGQLLITNLPATTQLRVASPLLSKETVFSWSADSQHLAYGGPGKKVYVIRNAATSPGIQMLEYTGYYNPGYQAFDSNFSNFSILVTWIADGRLVLEMGFHYQIYPYKFIVHSPNNSAQATVFLGGYSYTARKFTGSPATSGPTVNRVLYLWVYNGRQTVFTMAVPPLTGPSFVYPFLPVEATEAEWNPAGTHIVAALGGDVVTFKDDAANSEFTFITADSTTVSDFDVAWDQPQPGCPLVSISSRFPGLEQVPIDMLAVGTVLGLYLHAGPTLNAQKVPSNSAPTILPWNSVLKVTERIAFPNNTNAVQVWYGIDDGAGNVKGWIAGRIGDKKYIVSPDNNGDGDPCKTLPLPTTLTFTYDRQMAARYAIEQGKANNLSSPGLYRTSRFLNNPSIPFGRFIQNNLRSNNPEEGGTGSSLFLGEAIWAGGMPMTIDPSQDSDSRCQENFVGGGWRYCATELNALNQQGWASQAFKEHSTQIAYYTKYTPSVISRSNAVLSKISKGECVLGIGNLATPVNSLTINQNCLAAISFTKLNEFVDL